MQSSESLRKNSRVVSIYVDGNTAIEIEKEEPQKKARRVETIEEQRRQGIRQRRIMEARRKNKAVVCAAAVVGGAICTAVMILLLCSTITYNTLTNEIETLSSQLDTLTLQNDSTEYDIDSSVDLNEIIQTATDELGMVRSTASTVVTYSDADSEYINQVASVPTN